QLIPAVKWCFDHLGRKFFLIGSDYVFPRTANAIIKDHIAALKGKVLGEEYILLGSGDVKGVVRKIAQTRPDVILNTINGDTNVAFFKELRAAGITPKEIPTMSFSIAEDELRILGAAEMAGDYASWNYFQSIAGDTNAIFVKSFKTKYGQQRVTDDPMEAGYFGVHLWAQAVRDVGSTSVTAVRQAIKNQSFNAPEGIVYIDAENQHTWKTVRIGKIRTDGQFAIVWTSDKPVRPVPYPIFRLRSEWQTFLQDLYRGWGGKWVNPGA
ncbi:MAG: transporter substrate-binding protein, partial [Nitrospira sp.]|nr:transporter substrate-binding protein [Nitrospira sp.]